MTLGTRFSCRFAGFGAFAGSLSHVIALSILKWRNQYCNNCIVLCHWNYWRYFEITVRQLKIESKCNLLKVSSEPLRACREGNNDIANAPRPTARCAKCLSGETSSILRFGIEIAGRERISNSSSARLAVSKTKDISCESASHVMVRHNCWAAWRIAATMSRLWVWCK